MGSSTALRQLLNSLCHATRWKYAAFWKLEGMELSWEDCYFDYENSGSFLKFGGEVDIKCGNFMKCPIEAAVVSLSLRSYPLGEGIVGKVASQRKHLWAYADDVESILHEEFPEEWNQQSLAGIKTILLLPVTPLAVVQLGSLDVVLEDLSEVFHIRDCFGAILNTSGSCISLSPRMDWQNSYTPLAMHLAHLPPAMDVLNHILEADEGPYTDENQPTFSNLFADHMEESPAIDLSVYTDCIIEGDLSSFSWLEDEPNVTSSINHRLIPQHHIIPNLYVKDIEHKEDDQGFRMKFDEETNSIVDHACLSFPHDSELHKALGQSSKGYDDHMWNTIVSSANEWSSTAAFCQMEMPEVFTPVFEDADAWFTKERTEQLLDPLTAELLGTSDDNDKSSEPTCVRSCSNSPSKCSDSCLTHCKTEDGALNLGESVSHSYKRSLLASEKEGFINSPTKSSSTSTVNVSLGSGEQDAAYRLFKKGPKSTNASRKRANAGDIRKPKPRDRQLIQDRIKELRELIPDGSKCSIDALLDRAIKHMLFLQCIPSHAEKLKHSAQPKVKGEYWNSSGCHNHKNGASWAYELGKASKQCPIIVEDLDQPGQILVEIQCEDYELFLDIAHVIRHLKLTILKAILETRLDKPWAHFIVETPKGFHRMEIVWPLLQLLQRNNITMSRMF